jgi:regulatory protein
MPRRAPPTLRAQAVTWLAQRDHSERELRGKLLRRLRAGPSAAEPRCALDAPSAEAQAAAVDEVLTWLRGRGYLDDQRFAAARADGRAPRFGLARIRHELGQLGVELPAAQVEQLQATELVRAMALWERRFGSAAADPREAARQARFLAGRGFSGEVVRQVLRKAGRLPDSASSD